jgi:carbonic anhydrase
MKLWRIPIVLASVAVLVVTTGCATSHPHWSYEGTSGPAHWSELAPEFGLCSSGKRQSPIDLRIAPVADAEPVEFGYPSTFIKLKNNGHTVEVTPGTEGTIRVGGTSYALSQFHFHHPSEHTVEGKRYPLEVHLVHRAPEGLAVVAILFEEGAPNPVLESLTTFLPSTVGVEVSPEPKFELKDLMPSDRSLYRYQGSLTTPPCTEGVTWLIFKSPVSASPQQLEAITTRLAANSRPSQPRNDREVTLTR